MKILVVTNYKKDNRISYFVADQIAAITKSYPDVQIEVFGKKGSGVFGYLCNLSQLKQKIEEFQPDVIHAHYGLCGVLACLQRNVPVVTTFHGSDINVKYNRIISSIAQLLSKQCIFVSKELLGRAMKIGKERSHIIPCGISLDQFYPQDQIQCRRGNGIASSEKIVLFPAAKGDQVKNYPLAERVVNIVNRNRETPVRLMELNGYKRNEVPKVINMADVLMMTSLSEGSPQVIKEAIACGCPIVSVPVGDVRKVTENVMNAYVSKTYNEDELSQLLERALEAERIRGGGEILRKMGYDNATIASKIVEIYKNCIK